MVWPLPLSKPMELALPAITLHGDHIHLRPPRIEDWPQWSKIRGQNIEHLKPYEPEWAADSLTQEFFKKRLKRQIREWDIGNAQCFLIFETANHKLIGGMNINNICRGAAQYAALGYWIDKGYEGRGFMREALDVTLKYCFEDMKLHRINAACIPENMRSKNLLLSSGFVEEGFARKYLHINGVWQDHILFGICNDDFLKKKRNQYV